MSTLHYPYKIHLYYENLRSQLAEVREYYQLLNTYSSQSLHYPDLNTGKYWDDVFEVKEKIMPMELWRINKVIKLINSHRTVVNIGVGKGLLEEKLFKKYPYIEYHGTDITEITLSKLKKMYGKSKLSKQLLTNFSFKDRSFNQVLLLEVLEHVKPKYTFRVLSEIHRILSDNGTLILSVPINEHLENQIPFNYNSHMRMYSETLIKAELRISGFNIIQTYSAPAFSNIFSLKYVINKILKIREDNNLILLAKKT